LDSVAEKALTSHGLIPRRRASAYLDILIVQPLKKGGGLFTFYEQLKLDSKAWDGFLSISILNVQRRKMLSVVFHAV